MVRSELIAMMVEEFPSMPAKKVEAIVNAILETMVKTLSSGGRIEIRGFGTWCLRYRGQRNAHNPRTGMTIRTSEKWGVYFKAGKALREKAQSGKHHTVHGLRKGEGDQDED
ncbi:MAG: HU family DNA-binding protein [Pseudomonadota bacterium]|nr:HU family DNA-binding protein [Pseudomonadota bacterium]